MGWQGCAFGSSRRGAVGSLPPPLSPPHCALAVVATTTVPCPPLMGLGGWRPRALSQGPWPCPEGSGDRRRACARFMSHWVGAGQVLETRERASTLSVLSGREAGFLLLLVRNLTLSSVSLSPCPCLRAPVSVSLSPAGAAAAAA